MNSSLILKAFNKHFFDFFDDLIIILPGNEHITSSKEQLLTIKYANPTLLIKIWHYYIYTPYSTQIEEGNMSFFLEKDYTADLTNLPNNKDVIHVIDTSLRVPLRNMDEYNLDKCKKHFQVLNRICEKYHIDHSLKDSYCKR